jgi:hypothetical protein
MMLYLIRDADMLHELEKVCFSTGKKYERIGAAEERAIVHGIWRKKNLVK